MFFLQTGSLEECESAYTQEWVSLAGHPLFVNAFIVLRHNGKDYAVCLESDKPYNTRQVIKYKTVV